MERSRLTTHDEIKRFVLAGKATFTVVSKSTGQRFTFRVRRADERDDGRDQNHRPWFVSLLVGQDNEDDYVYMGCIWPLPRHPGRWRYVHGRRSAIGQSAPSAKALLWFMDTLETSSAKLDQVVVWHEGRCGRCGRKLTVPDSIATGFGPECGGRIYAHSQLSLC